MTTTVPVDAGEVARRPRRRLDSFAADRVAVLSLGFLCALTAAALLADVIVQDPTATDLTNRFAPPLTEGHLLGTDDTGRDLLARLIHGARASLFLGVGSVGLAIAIAVPIGIAVGYMGGKPDAILNRFVEFLLSIPPLIMVFAVAGILGPSLRNAVVALAVYFTPLFLRLAASESRRIRYSQMVEAAQAVGSRDAFIMIRHVAPNAASPIIVQASLSVGVAIIAEASLSFLGLGVRPPNPSWGTMLRSAFDVIERESWMIFVPATAMVLTVLAFNFVGDGLRQAFARADR